MVGYLFAGQGSQYIGMGKDLFEAFPQARDVFERADRVLGFSLSSLCFDGQPELLKQTVNSQPAIFTATIAAYEAFKSRVDLRPSFVAGLSLGEYTGLVAAGVLSFEDGLRLVRQRARIMEEATVSHPGKMAAVLELAVDKLEKICAASGSEIANLNAPGQVVISGSTISIGKAKSLCEEAGAKRVVELEVNGGFHSSLMRQAAAELSVFMEGISFSEPGIPLVSNFDAKPQRDCLRIKENLVLQMYNSVRWEESMRFMLSQGVDRFFEFGPGKVLKGLMRKIDREITVISVENKEDLLRLNKEGNVCV